MITQHIPSGWRELLPHEILTEGDKYLGKYSILTEPNASGYGKPYSSFKFLPDRGYVRKIDQGPAPIEEVDEYGRPMWFMSLFGFQECEFPVEEVLKRGFIPVPTYEKISPGDMVKRYASIYTTSADWVFTSKDMAVRNKMTGDTYGCSGLIRHVDSPYWGHKGPQEHKPVKRRRSAVTSFSDPLPLP